MANTAVTNSVCKTCGADVRKGSFFCYNCGSAVQANVDVGQENGGRKIEENVQSATVRPPLKSAASLRKQRRAFNRQPVEVIWEQPDRPPKAFFVVTAALTVAALILLVLAFYLR